MPVTLFIFVLLFKLFAILVFKAKPKPKAANNEIEIKIIFFMADGGQGAEAHDQERGVKEIKKFGYNGVVIQSQDADVF